MGSGASAQKHHTTADRAIAVGPQGVGGPGDVLSALGGGIQTGFLTHPCRD